MGQLREKMEEDLRCRGYRKSTCNAYIRYCRHFAAHFMRSPERLGEGEIGAYLDHLAAEKCGRAVITATAYGLKFLYTVTLNRPEEVAFLAQPKRALPPSAILNESELHRLLDSVPSPTVKAVMLVVAASDLAMSQACPLRPADIDATRMLIRAQQPHGRRDRYVRLTQLLLDFLRHYWKLTRPPGPWLFPATTAGEHVGLSTVREDLRNAIQACGIDRPVTDRVLKQSFLPHLLRQPLPLRAARAR